MTIDINVRLIDVGGVLKHCMWAVDSNPYPLVEVAELPTLPHPPYTVYVQTMFTPVQASTILSAAEAVNLISGGAKVASGGFVGIGHREALVLNDLVMAMEASCIGGLPASGLSFGAALQAALPARRHGTRRAISGDGPRPLATAPPTRPRHAPWRLVAQGRREGERR